MHCSALCSFVNVDGGLATKPWLLCHRVSLHDELKRLASSPDGKGPPVVLKTGSRVVDADPEAGTFRLESGVTAQGDLLIGADGVGSACRKVLHPDARVFGAGKSAFRFLIARDKLLAHEATRRYVEQPGVLTFWMGADRRFVMYPCENNTLLNFVLIHPTELSDTRGNDWNQAASREAMLGVYRDFVEPVRVMIGMADPASVKVWPLLDMKALPSWTRGKLALMGDAAHPFLPHQGQGGGVAIEDAGSLGALFPAGTPVEEIPERLKLYEQTRMERAEKIREFTRLTGRDILTEEEKKDFDCKFTPPSFSRPRMVKESDTRYIYDRGC
jgi:2-polyprenyl-6-methoxyphenol hydroxylase-like FAD-dependent oxidoreductase